MVGLAVVGAAIVAASAQIVIPIPGTPVPITGQTFGVLLVGAALGADNESVLNELGLSPAQIKELIESGALG